MPEAGKGGWTPENTARADENALGDFINGR